MPMNTTPQPAVASSLVVDQEASSSAALLLALVLLILGLAALLGTPGLFGAALPATTEELLAVVIYLHHVLATAGVRVANRSGR